MGDEGSEPGQRAASDSSSPSSGSLVSRHVYAIQRELTQLQAKVCDLQDQVSFHQDRVENLETQLRALEQDHSDLTDRLGSLEGSNAILLQRVRRGEEGLRASERARDQIAAIFAARYEHQQISIANLSRRLQDVERSVQ